MEDDSAPAKTPAGHVVGENLETLSVAELEARLTALKAEIVRIETERDRKMKHADDVASVFKS
ncbi:MAG: DUF1192 domain-containing protein [Pseudomonadota bacterium]